MTKPISLVIPTYKERDNITPLVERIHKAMSGIDYSLLFVDDNSRDGSEELVKSLAQKFPVKIMVRTNKRGLSSAVVDGMEQAEGDIVGVMDADLQHPPELLPQMVKAIENGADMAIGSRYVEGGGCRGWSTTRRIMSKGAGFIAHFFLPKTKKIHDPMSGFFMFRKGLVQGANLTPTGYKILLEMLVKGRFQNVTEVPYIFETRSRGESKLKTSTQIEYLKHIYALMKSSGELARFIKFILVGLSGVGVDEGVLWLLTKTLSIPISVMPLISAEVAIFWNFTFNNLFTFRDRRAVSAQATVTRFLRFNLICLGGVGIKMGIFLLFYHVVGLHELVANLIGIIVATLWNYTFSNRWAWKEENPRAIPQASQPQER